MTAIVMSINGIDGDVTVGAESNLVAAVGVQDVVLASGGDTEKQVSEVCVFRNRDRATPKLLTYAAAGTSITNVKIRILDNNNETSFQWELENVYVSRYEGDTPETGGIAYGPHLGSPGVGATDAFSDSNSTSTAMHDDRRYAYSRAGLSPRYPGSFPGVYQEGRVERVWFNASKIKWHSADGNITEGWDVSTNAAWE